MNTLAWSRFSKELGIHGYDKLVSDRLLDQSCGHTRVCSVDRPNTYTATARRLQLVTYVRYDTLYPVYSSTVPRPRSVDRIYSTVARAAGAWSPGRRQRQVYSTWTYRATHTGHSHRQHAAMTDSPRGHSCDSFTFQVTAYTVRRVRGDAAHSPTHRPQAQLFSVTRRARRRRRVTNSFKAW